MVTSWHAKVKLLKSPIGVVAAFLLKSRETLREQNRRLREEIDELQTRLDQQARQGQQQQRQNINAWKLRTAALEKRCDEARQSLNLPEDRPLGTHGYGARMISLAVKPHAPQEIRGPYEPIQTATPGFRVCELMPPLPQ